MSRLDKRQIDELRPITITKGFTKYAEGSVLIEVGETKILCNATVEEKIPSFQKGTGEGWITAEYAMLPHAAVSGNRRDMQGRKPNQRAVEIQRMIGRTLRSAVDLSLLGERTITIDCDVLQADGGTRTASITGGFVALALACHRLTEEKRISVFPLQYYVAAVSVGLVEKQILLDLSYREDCYADVDMNIVMTSEGSFVEVQGTGEKGTFSTEQLYEFLRIGKKGIHELIEIQKKALDELHLNF